MVIGLKINQFVIKIIENRNPMSTSTEEKTITKSKLCPKYKVLLHNDDHNSCEYVVECLVITVNTLSINDATTIMWEAHNSGIALVVTVAQEIAEFYKEQLVSCGLTTTIEPE